MKFEGLEEKLLAVARASLPDERVPYAFEQRIMARLRDSEPLGLSSLWGRALWRAAIPCVGLALILGVWSYRAGEQASARADFPKEFETAVLVALDQSQDQSQESW